MSVKIPIKTLVLMIVLLLVGVVGSNARAAALEGLDADALTAANGAISLGNVNEPVPGGPGYIMISPFQLKPSVSSAGSGYWLYFLYNPDPTANSYAAALTLPHGATITRMVVYYYDAVPANLRAYLLMCAVDSNNCYYMAEVSTTDSAGIITNKQDATIVSPEINNQSYFYMLEVSMDGGAGTNLRLMGVRLDYEIPSTTYLPIFMD